MKGIGEEYCSVDPGSGTELDCCRKLLIVSYQMDADPLSGTLCAAPVYIVPFNLSSCRLWDRQSSKATLRRSVHRSYGS